MFAIEALEQLSYHDLTAISRLCELSTIQMRVENKQVLPQSVVGIAMAIARGCAHYLAVLILPRKVGYNVALCAEGLLVRAVENAKTRALLL